MSEIVKVLKTEEQIHEADEREREIEAAWEAENRAAQQAFGEATEEAWAEYEAVWKPARERWEAFSGPHFKKLRARRAASEKIRSEALTEVRRDWKLCPRCGAPAARYQVHCTGEIVDKDRKPTPCGLNLLLCTSGR